MRCILLQLSTVILMLAGAGMPQELSTNVYPSEDELREALALNEIDIELYLRLQEIALFGHDSTARFLLDQIPNLSYFLSTRGGLSTFMESEQQRLVSGPESSAFKHGEFRYRWMEQLEGNGNSGYRLSGRLRGGESIKVSFAIHREYSGRERIVRRSVSYESRGGIVQNAILGSFTHRMGLGTVLGYRGKLLHRSDKLDSESFLYPDYGGFNGLLVNGQISGLNWTALGSHSRDSSFQLTTLGAMIGRKKGRLQPGVIVGVNRLKNRQTGTEAVDSKLGSNIRYKYTGGYSSMETCGQSGDFGTAGALVLEGRHRFKLAELRYAGWTYANRYSDLTAGSKGASLHRRIEIDEPDFEYTSRRSGQKGCLVRTIVLLADRLRLESSLLHAGLNRDTSITQLSAALARRFANGISLQADYLSRSQRLASSATKDGALERRARFEARFTSGNTSVRSYIAHNAKRNHQDHVSLFLNIRLTTRRLGNVEVWSNLSRLTVRGIDYWYLFVRNEQHLSDRIHMTTKLGNAYQRDSADKNRLILSMEFIASL